MRTVLKLAIIGDASSPNVLRWTEGLAGAGAIVALASFECPPPSWEGEFLPLRATGCGKQRYLAAVPALRRMLRRWSADVTAGYFVTGYGLLASLSAPGPLVQVGVGSDLTTTRGNHPLGRAVRFSLGRAALVLVWSEELAGAAVRLGASPDRLFVQPRGIPVEEFATIDPAGDVLAVVSTRSLQPFYRIDVLIEAMAHLPPHATLTIVGDGPEREALETKSRELGLSGRITFVGSRPNADLPRILARQGVYVSLAPRDGVSASLLEAMASGVVPVAVDNLANRAWVQSGRTGVLLRSVTPKSVADAILEASRPKLRDVAIPSNRALVIERGDLHANAARTMERLNALVTRSDARTPTMAARGPAGRSRLGVLFLARELAMGGAERQLVQLAVGLAERGHHVEVAVLRSGGALEDDLRQRGVRMHYLSAHGTGFPNRLRSLLSVVRHQGVDVLHSYLPGQNILAALVRPMAPSICIVWGVRSSRFAVAAHYNARGRLSYRVEPLLSRLTDLVITNSRAAREGANATRYPPRKTVTIPNGIDAEHFRPDPPAGEATRASLGVPADGSLILTVGRLHPVKGPDVLVEAVGMLGPCHPNWRYLVVGRGREEYRRFLMRRADDLGVAGTFIWREHEADLRPFYAAADVLCLPSRAEGFPNVVGEAMATGTPCVATDVGAVSEIVGGAGVVVPADDASALAAGIEAGLALPPETGEQARARIEDLYSVAAMVERTEEALMRAVALRRAR